MTDKINEDLKKYLYLKYQVEILEKVRCSQLCAFLASEMSDYITGETIHVNGGMYMS